MPSTARIVDRGTVFFAAPPDRRQSCQYPSLCVAPDGRWMCVIRTGPAKNQCAGKHGIVTWSDDQGRMWSDPIEPWAAPKLDGRPGVLWGGGISRVGDELLCVLYWVDQSRPELPFFNEKTSGILDCQPLLSRSRDGGRTWSPPRWIQTSFADPAPISGPILVFPDGELVLQVELNKRHDDTGPTWLKSTLLFSTDNGKTWPRHSIVGYDPENRIMYGDQRPTILTDGRLLDIFWTYDNANSRYLNMHARESRDRGRTWSAMWDTGVAGQPATPVELRDGRIALVYVDRTAAPAIKMRLSADGARSFANDELLIYDSNIASQTRDKTSWEDFISELKEFSVGLPSAVLLPDGDVLISYYAGPHPDRTGIYWARAKA